MYFYLITLQWQPEAGSVAMSTQRGTYTPPPEVTTREAAFEAIFKYAAGRVGVPNPQVMAFSLEKNDLAS